MTGGIVPGSASDAIEVGTVLGPWGIKGWLKVKPYAPDPQALLGGQIWSLEPGERSPAVAAPPLPRRLTILAARQHGDAVIAQAREVTDRDGAEALKGARVFVPRASFPAAGPDEFYWVDLIGLQVVNRTGDVLGTVAGLIDTGPHCVLRVAPDAADDEVRLIPFVSAYVDSVSLADRRVVVDWGLDY
jgi:16S rRNA processing protein RimM